MNRIVSIEGMDPYTAWALWVFGVGNITYKVQRDVSYKISRITNYNRWAYQRFNEFIHSLILQYFLAKRSWNSSDCRVRLSSLDDDLRWIDAHIISRKNSQQVHRRSPTFERLVQVDFTSNPEKINRSRIALSQPDIASHSRMLMVDHKNIAWKIAGILRANHGVMNYFWSHSELRNQVIGSMHRLWFSEFQRDDFTVMASDRLPWIIKDRLKI